MIDMPGEAVTRLRPAPATDRYGDPVIDWTAPDEIVISGCALDPGGSSETNDGRSAVDTRPTLYLPPGADLTAGDRLVVRGDTYEVDGKPAVWVDPFTTEEQGVVAPLRQVAG